MGSSTVTQRYRELVASKARRAALEAHRKVLDGVIDLLDSARVRAPASRWQHAILSLAAREVQLQRTIHDAACLGYADDELTPIARAMLSTLVTLAYIGRGRSGRERDARALAWAIQQRRSQDLLYEYLWRARRVSKKEADALTRDSSASYDAMLAEAAERRIVPAPKVGKRRDTWTGLPEKEFFRRAGYFSFYKDYYALWSNESHSGPTTLNAHLDQGRAGLFEIGPHERDLGFLLFATARFSILTTGHLNSIYRLRKSTAIRALFDAMQKDFSDVFALERTEGT